jgi:hypothetical protein
MIRLSDGLKSSLLGNYGLYRMLAYGVIDVYSGDQPGLADYSPTGTRLARITNNGLVFNEGSPTNGLEFDRTTQGALTDGGNWVLTGITEGVAGWWRMRWYMPDPGVSNPYYPRMDGLVGESLVLKNPVITPGVQIAIDRFYLTFRA